MNRKASRGIVAATAGLVLLVAAALPVGATDPTPGTGVVPKSSTSSQAVTPMVVNGQLEYGVHIRNIGWRYDIIGSTGLGWPLEAVSIRTTGTLKICGRAHVQDRGWLPWFCANPNGQQIVLGTVGQALQLEALQLYSTTHRLSAEAHVSNVGWQGARTNSQVGTTLFVGTTGQGRAIEALRLSYLNY